MCIITTYFDSLEPALTVPHVKNKAVTAFPVFLNTKAQSQRILRKFYWNHRCFVTQTQQKPWVYGTTEVGKDPWKPRGSSPSQRAKFKVKYVGLGHFG